MLVWISIDRDQGAVEEPNALVNENFESLRKYVLDQCWERLAVPVDSQQVVFFPVALWRKFSYNMLYKRRILTSLILLLHVLNIVIGLVDRFVSSRFEAITESVLLLLGSLLLQIIEEGTNAVEKEWFSQCILLWSKYMVANSRKEITLPLHEAAVEFIWLKAMYIFEN
ncbi:hypothetical protein BDC45DRAFT_536193 [Circinella umbellata]|nr:hypothetical protein BDC45DRAFT_536193 [Circinella umbellata]